jgi:hypothetical protein
MDESSFGVHQIEFVIESGEHFGNSGGVRAHTDGSHDFGQVTSWDDSGWLIVNSDFESSWTPIDELDGSFGFDGGNSGVDIFWDDVSSVHHRASHIFSVSWVAFNHHRGWLEDGVGNFSDG